VSLKLSVLRPSSAPGHAARPEDPTELTLPGPCRLPARLQRGRGGKQARAVIIKNDDVVRGGLSSAEQKCRPPAKSRWVAASWPVGPRAELGHSSPQLELHCRGATARASATTRATRPASRPRPGRSPAALLALGRPRPLRRGRARCGLVRLNALLASHSARLLACSSHARHSSPLLLQLGLCDPFCGRERAAVRGGDDCALQRGQRSQPVELVPHAEASSAAARQAVAECTADKG
jgi:hypothetical protein